MRLDWNMVSIPPVEAGDQNKMFQTTTVMFGLFDVKSVLTCFQVKYDLFLPEYFLPSLNNRETEPTFILLQRADAVCYHQRSTRRTEPTSVQTRHTIAFPRSCR